MTTQPHPLENLPAYAAGSLPPEERTPIDQHLAECPECTLALKQWTQLEEKMQNLFADVRPAPGLEDRMIQSLRTATPRRRLGKGFWIAAAVAAVILLGVFGAGLQAMVAEGNLPFPGSGNLSRWARSQISNNLKQLSLDDFARSDPFLTTDIDPAGQDVDIDINYHVEGLGEVSVAGLTPAGTLTPDGRSKRSHSTISSGIIGGKGQKSLVSGSDVQRLQKEAIGQIQAGASFGLSASRASSKKTEKYCADEKMELTDQLKATNQSLAEQGLYLGLQAPQSAKERDEKTGEVLKRVLREEKKEESAPHFPPPPANNPTKPATDSGIAGEEKKPGKVGQVLRIAEANVTRGNIFEIESQEKKPPEQAVFSGENRKLIRTGEVEFEIESFDKAVDAISSLVNAVKGGFVATINSDKLPNGKVRGAVVVRVPPESLDKLLTDLRRELGKAGELKSQRIGSQDITKQYTDVESRLRAARTMEDRLLNIIKTGKGEVKDLVAAERELGVWRTKIEEMEGEIRYYANQVSLSTLTINLVEKDIQAPAQLVVTERHNFKIEVEDVEKSQQEVLKAVALAKGRVTMSDLKQHPGGKLEAILQFEVAPDRAAEVRQVLPKLGTVTNQDAERLQKAEGGTGAPQEIKPKLSDVQFNVVLYNIADTPPRDTFQLQIASKDVPEAFRKLQDAANQAKGQVRTAQLNEQDKLNITAQFDFDVPTPARQAIDKMLAEVGTVLTRSTTQIPPRETATDKKVGYRLVLKSVAGIPPREKVTMNLKVKDVEQSVADLTKLALDQKGMVPGPQFSYEPNGQISAVLRLEVPYSAKDDLVRRIKSEGTVRSQQSTPNPQVPDSPLATAHIEVTLNNWGPIVPNDEGLWPKIRTSLFFSFWILSWSLMFVLTGLMSILPPVLVIWGIVKLVNRLRAKGVPQ